MKNVARYSLLVLVVVSSIVPSVLAANRTGLTRDEIKSLPITERPQRLGHIYGRTVRRKAGVVGWQLIDVSESSNAEEIGASPAAMPTPAK